ncbi:hypothetical protein GALMADRAFT_751816 [Galerina marginata CBS 339.88]|uniref:MYND-type domain-containing protein n=1 Tax=Galerina marginata (strain CBS 339.88) TaxID=685588 RepID=A0A067SNR6_GALM3|nr:hypothetical protein GALMADRAFT_751816 [Galerina marginata CBS 339.88]
MPGPRNRRRSRKDAKEFTTTPRSISVAEEYVFIPGLDIEEDLGWKNLIDTICQFLKLPNLDTRSGLKRIYANFEDIHSRMEELYRASENHIKIQGAIVGIFARMSADSILRNKLFEKDILNKIIHLLHEEETRHLALLALSIVTHHGGSSVRIEIAKHANDLTKLIRDLPDDNTVVELGVSTLAHSITTAAEGTEFPAYPQVLASIDLVEVLEIIMEVVKKPHPDYGTVFVHAIDLLSASSLHGAAAFKAFPTAIRFLAAGMRSKNWSYRCICLRSLIKLNRLGEDDSSPTVQCLEEAIDAKMPPHLVDIIDEYGSTRSHFQTYAFCSSESHKAIMAYTRNRDFYALGLKLAPLIVQTGYSITNMSFADNASHAAFPFLWWADSLPLSAKAIRAKEKPDERDQADILDINYLVVNNRGPEALAMLRRGIQRNPEQGFFYHLLSLSEGGIQGLRSAKKGMKCKTVTPYVKYALLECAIEYAANIGLDLLQNMKNPDDPSWKGGIAFLTSAIEDAKAYIEGAPPDVPYMRNACSWYILLRILMEPDISPDLSEFDDTLEKLSIATEFCDFYGFSPSKNEIILTQQLVLEHYQLGVEQFSSVFKNFDEARKSKTRAVDRENAADDLADWLEGSHLEDSGHQKHDHYPESAANVEIVIMYQCSWCTNTSAVLRKCRGCVQARYCDTSCQKAHWPKHKKVCGLQS